MASESCILALGWVSGFFVLANVLCSCQLGHHLAVLLALTYVPVLLSHWGALLGALDLDATDLLRSRAVRSMT